MSFIIHQSSKKICADCIENHFFRDLSTVSDNVIYTQCDYCHENCECITVQEIVERINCYLMHFYTESEKTDQDGNTIGEDLWDILDYDIRDELNDELFSEIVNCFDISQKIEENNNLTLEYDVKNRYGLWSRFCSKAKFENPFFCIKDEEEKYYKNNIFSFANKLVEILQNFKLFRILPAGQILYRCRNYNPSQRVPKTEDELGPAPNFYSRIGTRMSPAGNGLFYASEDRETASEEALLVNDKDCIVDRHCVIGKWKTTKDLIILDLVDIPETGEKIATLSYPSIFDSEKLNLLDDYTFLVPFVHDISRSIKESDHELDYRPTQLLCAYLMKHVLICDQHIDAIRFQSSKCMTGVNFCGFWGYCRSEYNFDKKVELLSTEII